MEDRRTASLLTIAAAAFLAHQAGCVLPIPLAAWPAPEVGSGLEVQFDNECGERIEKDGLLIVHREYLFYFWFGSCRGAPSNHLVEIRDGRAKLPHEWAIHSLWLQNYVPYLPTLPWVFPDENLELIPLIPDYHPGGPLLYWDRVKEGRVTLLSYGGRPPRHSRNYWSNTLRQIRRCWQEKPRHGKYQIHPDLRLPDDEYFKVRRLIQEELRRRDATQTERGASSQNSQPLKTTAE